MTRLVVAITGATGAVYGVRLLQHLRQLDGVETHLIVSDAAVLTLHQETGLQRKEVEALAHVVHKQDNVGASIASGSFQTDGMVIAPCSMKTLASVAHGLSDNLIARAPDVARRTRWSRSTRCFRASRNAVARRPAPSPGASSRCWRSDGA